MSLHRRILLTSEINGPDLYQYSSSPPLPTNLLLADSSTAAPFQRHLSNAAIASVSAVSAAIFLALTYYSVLRHRRRRLLSPSDESYSSAADETSDDDDGGGAHHVWNIRTVGLDNSAILSLGSYAYLPPSGTDGRSLTVPADCPVCLGDLEDGDMVRLLPMCDHVFHVSCIDPWLRAHVSCPLCRAHILPPHPSAAGGADGETRVGVLSDTEAPPSPPPPPPEEEDDPGSPIDHRSVTTETEMEERGGEERKDDNSGEDFSKEVEVPSSSGSGRVFFFARMSRSRSSSILPV